ncbi:MAG: hypothetical protein JW932_08260 [Deltaproteobacteria bacterium]|nr:hypothetical protein [Deltaproteobacteria bacterium]
MSENTSNIISTNLDLGSSHLTPVPLGVSIKTKIERGDAYSAPEIFDLEITVLEILRGQEAWDQVRDQGVTDGPLSSGFEYVLVRIGFGYYRRGRGFGETPYTLTNGQFIAISSDGKTRYEMPSVFKQPEPGLMGESFIPGDSREGWVLLQVPRDEKQPRLVFNREYVEGVYGIWGFVWFELFMR